MGKRWAACEIIRIILFLHVLEVHMYSSLCVIFICRDQPVFYFACFGKKNSEDVSGVENPAVEEGRF